MGKGCSFKFCRTNKGRYQYDYGISCFRFPKTESIRQIWVDAINRGPEWKPTKDTVVCEKHFSVEDLLLYNGLTRIKPGAVPKLNLTEPIPSPTKDKVDQVLIKEETLEYERILPDYNVYCRLCAQPKDESVEFQNLSDETLENLTAFLPGLKINESLQKNCCAYCLDQINEIMCFKEQCERAEEKLLEIQKKNEMFEALEVEDTEVIEMEIEAAPEVDVKFEEVNLPPSYENRPKGSRAKFFLEELELIKGKDPPYNCPYCEKVVKTVIGFRLHILFVHKNHSTKNYKKLESFGLSTSDGRPCILFACPACQLSFKQKKDLIEHIKTHDFSDEEELLEIEKKVNSLPEVPEIMLNKSHLCELCGKSFKQKIGLITHMKFHLKQKDYECDLCNRKFYLKADLSEHLGVHAGKTFKCPMCPKEFKSTHTLRVHKKLHSEDSYKFSCHLCGKKFMVQYKLNYHMDKHEGRRSFICEYCGKGFLYNYMRDQHLMKDHNVKIEGRKIYNEKPQTKQVKRFKKRETMSNSESAESE